MTRQQPPSGTRANDTSDLIAFQRERARSRGEIKVSSPQIRAGAMIAPRHTAYGDGIAPAVRWSPVDAALSYVLLVEDPDAPTPQPFVHWLAWNIPPGLHELPEGMPPAARPDAVRGMRQGINGQGQTGYFGPRPPQGDAPHHYHFQVFALDCSLALADDADRDDLLAAIDGHVLAKGQLIATSKAPTSQ